MIVLASWDDGAVEDLRIAELMQKYEIPCIFYWSVFTTEAKNFSKIKSFLLEDDRKKISQDFEIGSHTLYHNFLTQIPIEQAEVEIVQSKIALEKYNKINSFCYPRGYANEAIKKIIKKAGYLTARSTLVGNTKTPTDDFFIATTAHVGIQRQEYNDVPWLDYSLNKLKQAETDGYFHIFGHSWEIEKNNSWKDLETLLKAIK
jgi:peptidoglycan/xylan/chitin deacetylase (PgdA/CDA1 family)